MTRYELDERWTLLAEGGISRTEAHAWADSRLKGAEVFEPMVMTGLQTLHGLTGVSFEPSLAEIARLRDAWRIDCGEYDADPVGWRRERAIRTLRGLSRDYPEKAADAAAVFLREGILMDQDVSEATGRTLT